MIKHLYEQEFELNASAVIIFPFLSTLSGLEQWLADSAKISPNKTWNLTWDEEDHYLKKVAETKNKMVKYEFLSDNNEPVENPDTLEFKLEINPFTGILYLKVLSYSEENDNEELNDLWAQLIQGLRDLVAA